MSSNARVESLARERSFKNAVYFFTRCGDSGSNCGKNMFDQSRARYRRFNHFRLSTQEVVRDAACESLFVYEQEGLTSLTLTKSASPSRAIFILGNVNISVNSVPWIPALMISDHNKIRG